MTPMAAGVWHCGRYALARDAVHVMGIVNVTPDSFSDGGQFIDSQAAIAHAWQLIDEGANIIDIGAESTRPGAQSVSAEQQLARCLPVVRALRDCPVPISVDTSDPHVMMAVLAEGATILNDVRSFEVPGASQVAAASDCGLVIMHRQGEPQTMQLAPSYSDVVCDVTNWLRQRAQQLQALGIHPGRLAIDPGFGFGKTVEHNVHLLTQLDALCALGYPVLAGLSRKSFLGHLTGRSVQDRFAASLAGALLALQKGARILRVHDVAATCDVVAMWRATQA